MELRHLRYFVAAGEEQHFGRAAERLRIAQPALSRQIQDLENEIGFELFDRLSRGVKLSAAGESLLEDARGILRDVNEAIMRAGKVAHRTGALRVGFIESLSWHGVVPRSFPQFRQRHPDATLELRSLSSLDQVEAVRLGKLDAGYVYRPLIKDRNLAHVQVALHSVMLAFVTCGP
jgi:DNA-binding transcriptional LysR family regulator